MELIPWKKEVIYGVDFRKKEVMAGRKQQTVSRRVNPVFNGANTEPF